MVTIGPRPTDIIIDDLFERRTNPYYYMGSMLRSFTVEEDQAVAAKLINALRNLYPNDIVAGGAPRDWFHGTPCNDIDIYVCVGENNTLRLDEELIKEVLEPLGCRHSLTRRIEATSYKGLEEIKGILDFSYKVGFRIQVMPLRHELAPSEVMSQFDCSICQAYFDGNECVASDNFMATVETGILFPREEVLQNTPHYQKIQSRFGQYVNGTEQEALHAFATLQQNNDTF